MNRKLLPNFPRVGAEGREEGKEKELTAEAEVSHKAVKLTLETQQGHPTRSQGQNALAYCHSKGL